jgi:hypothetical protein
MPDLYRYRRHLLVLYTLGLLALTLVPASFGAGGPAGLDKLVHAGMFAGLALLLYWNLFVGEEGGPALIGAVVAVAAAALIEVLQIPIPERSGEVWDFLAGALGGSAAAAVVYVARARGDRRPAPHSGETDFP